MPFDLKDLLEKQAFYRFGMGLTISEVLEPFKDENLTPDEQEALRIKIQKIYYSNEQDSDY